MISPGYMGVEEKRAHTQCIFSKEKYSFVITHDEKRVNFSTANNSKLNFKIRLFEKHILL